MKRSDTRVCAWCKVRFIPRRPGDKVCSEDCGVAYGMKAAAKVRGRLELEDRRVTKAKLDSLKTLPKLVKEAQIAFNSFIRQRDREQPCICCGLPLGTGSVGGAFDAGHYRSIGSAPHLRFNEDNCHAQKKSCNRFGSGRAVDYRLGLIARIGLAAVEALENDNAARHYTKDELRALAALYRAKLKELMGRR